MKNGIYYFLAMIVAALVTYGQLAIKIGVTTNEKNTYPTLISNFFLIFSKPLVLSGFVSGFIATILWMHVIANLELSKAYPFTAISFVFIPVFSYIILGEQLTVYKIAGSLFIILGITISSIVD